MNLAWGWLLAHRATSSSYCLKILLMNGKASKIAKDCFFSGQEQACSQSRSRDPLPGFQKSGGEPVQLPLGSPSWVFVWVFVTLPKMVSLTGNSCGWTVPVITSLGKRKHFPGQTLPDQNIPQQTSVITCRVTKKDEFLVQPDFCMQTLGLVRTINK